MNWKQVCVTKNSTMIKNRYPKFSSIYQVRLLVLLVWLIGNVVDWDDKGPIIGHLIGPGVLVQPGAVLLKTDFFFENFHF